jgi:hypothetical protein
MNSLNTLETLEAALAHHKDLVMSYAKANPKITALCSPEMLHSAMQLGIHEHEIFHLSSFDDYETNYILCSLAQQIGVREGIQEQFKLAFVAQEEPSEELQAKADQFLELVKETPFDFSVAYWEEQLCELIEAAGETSEFDEEEMDFHEPEPMPEPKIATPAAVPPAASSTAPEKRPCRDWVASGRCKFGDKCHFAHESVAVVAAGGGASRQPCREWAQGKCKFGDKCRYSHAVPS